jgi:hypothetical protein
VSEAAFFWIIGGQAAIVLGLLGILYARQNNHEQRCIDWQRNLMVEHGKLVANVDRLLRREDLR